MRQIMQSDCDRTAREVNTRPCERCGFRTSAELTHRAVDTAAIATQWHSSAERECYLSARSLSCRRLELDATLLPLTAKRAKVDCDGSHLPSRGK